MVERMKKYTAWLLVLGLSLTVTGCKLIGGKESPAEEETPTVTEIPAEAYEPEFESVDYGFSVQGPDGWVKKADVLGMLVTYVKPGNPDTFQQNISVARESKNDMSLVDYAKTTVAQVEELFEGSEILEQTETKIKDQDAAVLKYKIKIEDLDLMSEQIIINRPNEGRCFDCFFMV